MDAFAVAIASGIALKRVSGRQTFRLAWHFGLFQALMPLIGWSLGTAMYELVKNFDHWVAFSLLAIIGGKMIYEALGGDKDTDKIKDPTRGAALVMLSVGTSIDAFAVGLSFSLLGISIWLPILIIGVVALVFTAVGLHIGGYAGEKIPIGKYAELLGGAVLISIGVKILFEHGVFG